MSESASCAGDVMENKLRTSTHGKANIVKKLKGEIKRSRGSDQRACRRSCRRHLERWTEANEQEALSSSSEDTRQEHRAGTRGIPKSFPEDSHKAEKHFQ